MEVIKKEFWDAKHIEDNDFWLTGSSPHIVYSFHDFKVPVNKRVLEIGVGRGDSIKLLAKNNSVIAIDISEEALKKVSGVAKTYLTKDLPKIPSNTVDFALSHLVLQHCDSDMVVFIISEVVRILKHDAVFSFQFANVLNTQFLDKLNSDAINDGLLYFRSEENMDELINKSCAVIKRKLPIRYWIQKERCTIASDGMDSKSLCFSWHIYEVGKLE